MARKYWNLRLPIHWENQFNKKWKFLAIVAGLSSVFIAESALANPFYNPTYPTGINSVRIPVDATYWEWNGQYEIDAFRTGADLFCRSKGYRGVFASNTWRVEKGSQIASRGTYRFSRETGQRRFCAFCRWHLAYVLCRSTP